MNNLELETVILKHKKALYLAEKDLYVYTELMNELLDKVSLTNETDMPALENMIKAIDKKITSTKIKMEVSKKAISILGF